MAFAVVSVLAVLALALRLSLTRHLETLASPEPAKPPRVFRWKGYFDWLSRRGRDLLRDEPWRAAWPAAVERARRAYPGAWAWVFAALAASTGYLAASGLFFAVVFPRRGMFGVLLVGHMAAGALFAFALAAVLFFRARAYAPGASLRDDGSGRFAFPVLGNPPLPAVRAAIFWSFAVLGFIQTATALGSMLPVFTFAAQQALLAAHRWAGLAIALFVIIAADLDLPRAART